MSSKKADWKRQPPEASNKLSLLYIIYAAFFPPFRGDAARILELIHLFRQRHWKVSVAYSYDPYHPAPDCLAMSELCDGFYAYFPSQHEEFGIPTKLDSWCPKPFAQMVGALCDTQRFDVAFAQLVFNTRCFEHIKSSHTLKVLDADNVFSRRHELFKAANLPYTWLQPTLKEEAAAWARADIILSVQEDEAQIMQEAVPHTPVITIPACHETLDCRNTSGHTLLIVGNDSVANRAGLEQFVTVALPEVRARFPDTRLLVVGRVGKGFHNPRHGIISVGLVDDLIPYYKQASIVVAPVPVGTGIKRKTIDALCYGKCLVATPGAIQGLERYSETYELSPSPEQMGEVIVKLFREPARIGRIADRAFEFASSYFAPNRVFDRLESRLTEALTAKRKNSNPVD